MSGVILMYHRVAAPGDDTYGLAVTPDRFNAHAEHLARLGCVVPLAEIRQPGNSLKIALTFDDGYADNATTAAPLLASAGLPATYFITTGRLGGQHFWWDRLATGLLGEYPKPTGIDVSVGGRDVWVALNDAEARRTSLSFLHWRLLPLPPDELLATVNELLAQLGAPEPPDDAFTMTVDQLRAMSRLPQVEIGAHTRTHVQLKGQTERVQQHEVMGSVADLAAILGQPVTSFAYPFGGHRAVGDLAPRLTREAGCIVACTTERGPVVGRSDHHRLPRLNVRDWDATELAAQIQQVAHAG